MALHLVVNSITTIITLSTKNHTHTQDVSVVFFFSFVNPLPLTRHTLSVLRKCDKRDSFRRTHTLLTLWNYLMCVYMVQSVSVEFCSIIVRSSLTVISYGSFHMCVAINIPVYWQCTHTIYAHIIRLIIQTEELTLPPKKKNVTNKNEAKITMKSKRRKV